MRPLLLAFFSLAAAGLAAQSAPAIHVEVRGAGAPTLLLPGFATPAASLGPVADSLGGGRAYYFVDYAGTDGLAPVDTPFYAQVRDALVAYVEEEDLRDVDVVGHSMGGNLAVELAAALPERVAHVAIVDALPCMRAVMMPGVPASAIRYDAPQTVAMLAMDSASVAGANAQMAAGMTSAPERQARLATWLNAADRRTFVLGYTDLLRLDLRPLLPRVAAPVTVLASPSFGAEVVRDNMTAQYAGLADADLHVAPAGGHYLMWDAPAWTAARLREALTEGARP